MWSRKLGKDQLQSVVFQLVPCFDNFKSILHWSQIKPKYIMVFKIINDNSRDIILKVLCVPFCIIRAAIGSSINVYGWLITSESSDLSEMIMFIIQRNFTVRSSECSVCIHCKYTQRNWSIANKCFFEWTDFVWRQWWKSSLESPNYWTSRENIHECPFSSSNTEHWGQFNTFEAINKQIPYGYWGCLQSCKNSSSSV